jgi:peptidoglycan/xylan/chitin deacetylase (PgdA/CDA1 family)
LPNSDLSFTKETGTYSWFKILKMKRMIKKIAHYSGLFRFSAWLNRDTIKILMYHGISNCNDTKVSTNFNGKHMNLDAFEGHLRLITKYCTPISLKMLLSKKKLPTNPIVLTFDDGYKNNYTYAFPLLKKYNIPATIFITTGFIDRTHYMWPDRLEFIINNAHSKNIDLLWEEAKLKLELGTDKDKMNTIRFIKNYAKALSEPKKLSFLDKLQEDLGIEYDWDKIPSLFLPLTWDEIRKMNENGLISIGSHTVSHPILSNCTSEQQKKELMLSRLRIGEELGEDCIMFAYPNGEKTDYNKETINILRESKYLGAVNVVPGYINMKDRDNFQLNRFGAGINLEELGTIITGLSHLVGTI